MPRHTLSYIPNKAGWTQANLKRLAQLSRISKNARSYGFNNSETQREVKAIMQRIKVNGGYANMAALQAALMPRLQKYVRLHLPHRQKLIENENNNRYQNAIWGKVQTAAGKFKAMGRVAAMRPKTNNKNAARRLVGPHSAHTMINLLRPYILRNATPVTTTYNEYMRGPRRTRTPRATPARRASPPSVSVTTRSGRRSVKPRA